MTQQTMRWVRLLMFIVSLIGTHLAYGYTHGPHWNVGRAIIVSMRNAMSRTPRLYLKLSLRNTGTPGRAPVRIYGRWTAGTPQGQSQVHPGSSPTGSLWGGPATGEYRTFGGSRWTIPATGSSAEGGSMARSSTGPRYAVTVPPQGVRLLGSYSREVSLNQTAILEVPLAALGMPKSGATRLEVVIMTASVITDHQFVALDAH